jgi:hypothetical protein
MAQSARKGRPRRRTVVKGQFMKENVARFNWSDGQYIQAVATCHPDKGPESDKRLFESARQQDGSPTADGSLDHP